MLFKLGALNKAIAADDLAQVKDLLARYPQLQTKTRAYECMDRALAKGSDEMVLALAAAGWNLMAVNTHDRTALQEAVYNGRQAIVTHWIAQYPLLWTPQDRARLLLTAVEKKDNAMLRFLIDSGISDPAVSLPYYENPLHKAQVERNQDAVQILRAAIAARGGDSTAATPLPAQAQAPAPVQTAADAAQWHMVDDTTIIRTRAQRTAGYRLTDIFNFALGTCVSVQCNLETGAETAVTIDLSQAASSVAETQARAQLQRLGGNPPALRAPSVVKKASGG